MKHTQLAYGTADTLIHVDTYSYVTIRKEEELD